LLNEKPLKLPTKELKLVEYKIIKGTELLEKVKKYIQSLNNSKTKYKRMYKVNYPEFKRIYKGLLKEAKDLFQ